MYATRQLIGLQNVLMRAKPPLLAVDPAGELITTDDGIPSLSFTLSVTDTLLISPVTARVDSASGPGCGFDLLRTGWLGSERLAMGETPERIVAIVCSTTY